MAKGKIMAEEYRSQIAERMPLAARAMEKALGKTSGEISLMMERGELISKDVLPKFGKALREVANDGGALDASLKTVGITQKKFFTSATKGADNIFKGGFGEGIAAMFTTMTASMNESEEALQSFGRFFKLIFDVVSLAIKAATPIVDSMLFVLGQVSEVINSLFVNDASAISAGIILLALNAKKVVKVFDSLYFRLFGVLALLDEIFALFAKGRVGVIETALGVDWGGDISKGMTGLDSMFSSLGIENLGVKILTLVAAVLGLKYAITALTGAILGKKTAGVSRTSGKRGGTPRGGTGGKRGKPTIKPTSKHMDDVLRRTKPSFFKTMANKIPTLSSISSGLGGLLKGGIIGSALAPTMMGNGELSPEARAKLIRIPRGSTPNNITNTSTNTFNIKSTDPMGVAAEIERIMNFQNEQNSIGGQ
jgi:hypothetical protein